jgi:hypothetical protein
MNKKLLIALFSLCSISCMAIDLDSDMTAEDKKTTGYDSLTKEQKKALNLWLTKNTMPVKKNAEQAALSLNINIDGGRLLILSDGTKWEVAPEDRNISGLWLTPISLKILPGGSPEYPNVIMNSDSEKEKVKDKQVH